MKKIIIKILLIVLFSVFGIQAQSDTSKTIEKKGTDTVFVMQKSPWGAVLRSAIIPGWGQFYNQSYWKIPVVWGAVGYFLSVWIKNNNDYKTYRDQYDQLKDLGTSDYRINVDRQRALTFRDFYRDQRDLFAIYLGISYLLNLVDSYVDAQLFDFTVKEDFMTKSPYMKMSFKVRF